MPTGVVEKGGVAPDKWLKHRSIYSESLLFLQEATSENQAKLKAAKSDGIHIDAMKFVSKLNRQDPGAAAVFLRTALEGALIEKCAFMFQGDMLNGGSIADLLKVAEPSAKAVASFKAREALEIGHAEGLQGGSIDNLQKQFAAGSALLTAAIQGFKRGRAFMEQNAAPNVVPIAPSKGRRGGRGKNDDGPAAPVPREANEPNAASAAIGGAGEAFDDKPAERPVRRRRGRAAAPTPPASSMFDLEEVLKLSNHKMAKVYNELTGSNIVKFENRTTARAKFEALAVQQAAAG